MDAVATLAIVAKISGLTGLTVVSSVRDRRIDVDTFVTGDACFIYTQLKVPRGDPDQMFTTWYYGGRYRAESVNCPAGVERTAEEIAAGMTECMSPTPMNSFALITRDPDGDARLGELFKFYGSMLLNIHVGDSPSSGQPDTHVGVLACVSSTCSCALEKPGP